MHVSGLTSAVTWKTTSPDRHRKADELILGLCEESRSVVLDVGASDGVTSLELIEKLGGRFERFFVTDKYLSVRVIEEDGRLYFYSGDEECVVMSTRTFVVYADRSGWWPFTWVARWLLSRAPKPDSSVIEHLWLVQPELRRMADTGDRVILREYDMFTRWTGPAADVIKVGNLLNLDYFSRDQIRLALLNMRRALKPGGRLVVTENRGNAEDRASMYVLRRGRFVAERTVNGGCGIDGIALGMS